MTALDDEIAVAERWFLTHGLPWFVDRLDSRVARLLARNRLVPVVLAAVVLAGLVAGPLGAATDAVTGLLVGALVVLVVLGGYVGGALRVGTMARWAVGRVVRELELLLPLVTRALPLLLLFMTFLFINTEVWQVASSLRSSLLWSSVLLFGGVATMFLLTRLPAEVRRVEREAAVEGVARICRGTPFEQTARALALGGAGDGAAGDHEEVEVLEPLTRTQRANLVLVLLVAQSLQVLLLATAVFGFFVIFGLVAIGPTVVDAWIGHPPTYRVVDLFGTDVQLPVSHELFQVAVFLSAFAGLYFTVYAVSDPTYRREFFAELATELERAVGVRTVYRALMAAREPGGRGAAVPGEGPSGADS